MKNPVSFAEVLEAADGLSAEDQETLIEILHRRVTDIRRQQIAKDVRSAQQQFRKGGCRVASAADIMGEIVP